MDELSITELQAQMSDGRLSAHTLVESYLNRIRQIDWQKPALNSVIEINPDALDIAAALDEERRSKGPRGPLHGIPILLKDNIDTADAMSTTAGSLALMGAKPTRDAFLVTQLRTAGAVILGKTNLSEWANFRSSRSTSGWSSRGGQVRNPYALDRNPCGSSSGSAVAVAANLCTVAVGTETDGSIVCPASINGIVGLKPTVGLISRSGIIPIAHSQDTAGPMARTVMDAAILLGALVGVDPDDPATAAGEGHAYSDYTQFLAMDGLRGVRIGVARQFFGVHPKVDQIMEAALGVMKQSGAELIDPANVETVGQWNESEMEVLLYEFKADLNHYLARLGSTPIGSLAEIIEFNQQHQDRVMPYFGQETFLEAADKGRLTDEAYLQALRKNHDLTRTQGIDATLQEHKLTAIIAPTAGPAWLTDLVNGDRPGGSSSSPAAVAGYPSITVPAGYIFGLPVGISFFAGAYQEGTLIRLAYAFERATKVRRRPQFLPTVTLSG